MAMPTLPNGGDSLKINHHCIICDTGYDYCNDCNKINSWRKVACSHECYLTYLAYLDYRDVDHDAVKFAQRIDQIQIEIDKLPPALKAAYQAGLAQFMIEQEPEVVFEQKQEFAPTEKTNYKQTRNKK